MTATIVAGILSNPACAIVLNDQYQQQHIIQETFQNIIAAFSHIGVPLAADEPINREGIS